MAVKRIFHQLTVDGKPVVLRIFLPSEDPGEKVPAILMVCGLMWLGQGALGRIGLKFNDRFGNAFACRGRLPCVQIHTPCRHLAHTRVMDVLTCVVWPLCFWSYMNIFFLTGDIFMLAASAKDLLFLLLVPVVYQMGPLALIAIHLLIRLVHWLEGTIPGPPHPSHHKEVAAAVEWLQQSQALMRSNGKIIFCGYSSGAHCAALYALSEAAPRFETVLLISGIYDIQTKGWTGCRRLLTPVFNLLYNDTLGVSTEADRKAQSPVAVVGRRQLQGQSWYILCARSELMGMQPVQDILFQAAPLCERLTASGAEVFRMTNGLNHWLLVANAGSFAEYFGGRMRDEGGADVKAGNH